MIKLLVQFKSVELFGGSLELLGEYEDINEAVLDGISLYDETVDNILVNKGGEYLKLERTVNYGIQK